MQSSLSFFVSGQAQQIFFFGFVSGAEAVVAGCCAESEASVCTDAVFPISGAEEARRKLESVTRIRLKNNHSLSKSKEKKKSKESRRRTRR